MFRFELSPSKDISLNDLKIALFNYISSISDDKKFTIRIKNFNLTDDKEDMSQEHLKTLELFGIKGSDLAYQSYNLKFQQQLATKLLMDKNAFSCFCTAPNKPYDGACENLSDEDVLTREDPFSIRVKKPSNDIEFDDMIKGRVKFFKDEFDSFVILDIKKMPRDDFATAIDDILSDISTILIDKTELKSTSKQILIQKYLGYDKEITYATLPTIKGGEVLVKDLLCDGFLPNAIINYIITLSYNTSDKIFELGDMIDSFKLEDIKKSSSTFDLAKLKEINKEHIKKTPPLQLATYLGYSSLDLGELAKIYTKFGSTINEIKPKIDAIFAKKEPDIELEGFDTLFKLAKEAPFCKSYDEFEEYLLKESGFSGKDFSKTLKFILTGSLDEIDLKEIYPFIKNYLGEIIK